MGRMSSKLCLKWIKRPQFERLKPKIRASKEASKKPKKSYKLTQNDYKKLCRETLSVVLNLGDYKGLMDLIKVDC